MRVPGAHRIGGGLGSRVGVDGWDKGKSRARYESGGASLSFYLYPRPDYAVSGLIET